VRVAYAADMRYVGQEHPVTVDLGEAVFRKRDRQGLKRHFDDEHLQRYGTNAPKERAEIVSLRASVAGMMKKPALERIAKGGRAPARAAAAGKRNAWFGGKRYSTPAYRRDALLAGNRIEGPALIEEHASTTVVMPGDRLRVDDFGNLVLEIDR
jgi:N-methylhydantoinase A